MYGWDGKNTECGGGKQSGSNASTKERGRNVNAPAYTPPHTRTRTGSAVGWDGECSGRDIGGCALYALDHLVHSTILRGTWWMGIGDAAQSGWAAGAEMLR